MVLCRQCGIERRTEGSEYCRYCVMCNSCGAKPWTNTVTRRCAACCCVKCGAADFDDYRIGSGARMRLCQKCYYKEMGISPCVVCKHNIPNIFRRGDKKVSLCVTCAVNDPRTGHKATHYCCFCKQKSTGVQGKWLVCPAHKERITCQVNCTPGAQCARCVVRQRENERIVRLNRERAVLTQFEHERGEGGECFQDCRACREVAAATVLFEHPITFWPEDAGPSPLLKMGDRRKIKSSRYLSAEIEVAGLHAPQKKDLLVGVVKKWGGKIVRDGSLPPGGFEINTAPAAGDFFYRQLEDIGAALAEAGAFVTNRCGTHIHADARDYRYTDLTRLILYYEKIEPALIMTQPTERGLDNEFCRRIGKQLADAVRQGSLPEFYKKEKGKTQQFKASIYKGVYNGHPIGRPPRTDHYGHPFGDVHYHSMNLHSWFFRGTIENRIHSGTIVARKIIDWATTWQAVLDRALSITLEEIKAIDDPVAELLKVSPTERSKAYIRARILAYEGEYKARGYK